jgi:hypothetical protein
MQKMQKKIEIEKRRRKKKSETEKFNENFRKIQEISNNKKFD